MMVMMQRAHARNHPDEEEYESDEEQQFQPRPAIEAPKQPGHTDEDVERQNAARDALYGDEVDIEDKDEDEHYTEQEKLARDQAKEIVWYIVFLVLFSFAALYGENLQDYYWFRRGLRNQLVENEFPQPFSHVFKSFGEAETVSDMFQYMNGVFYQYTYSADTFDGDRSYRNNTFGTANDKGWLLGYGQIVGKIRVGQIRVQPESCSDYVSDKILLGGEPARDVLKCYPEFDSSVEDLRPFGSNPNELFTTTRDLYPDEPNFVSTATTARYPSPAFSVLLPRTEPAGCPLDLTAARWPDPSVVNSNCLAGRELSKMMHNKWVDLQTRAVYIDMNVYSYSLDRLAVVRIFFELRRGGGVVPSVDVDVMRPYLYHTVSDYALLVLDLIVLLFVLAYLFTEVTKIYSDGFAYFTLGNIPHFTNLCLFLAVWGYRIASLNALPSRIDVLSPKYIELRKASDYFKLQRSINSFNVFLSWVKIFKYLSFLPQFAQVTRTLSSCAANLGGFFLVIGIVLFGSGQAFLLAFGTKMSDYRNLQEGLFSLIRALLLDFDLRALREANLWLGPIFFGSFILLAVFVLLNMFIAIISDAYSDTKDQLIKDIEEGRLNVLPYMREYFIKMMFKIPLLKGISRRLRRAVENKKNRVAAEQAGQDGGANHELAVGAASILRQNTFAKKKRKPLATKAQVEDLTGVVRALQLELSHMRAGATPYRVIELAPGTQPPTPGSQYRPSGSSGAGGGGGGGGAGGGANAAGYGALALPPPHAFNEKSPEPTEEEAAAAAAAAKAEKTGYTLGRQLSQVTEEVPSSGMSSGGGGVPPLDTAAVSGFESGGAGGMGSGGASSSAGGGAASGSLTKEELDAQLAAQDAERLAELQAARKKGPRMYRQDTPMVGGAAGPGGGMPAKAGGGMRQPAALPGTAGTLPPVAAGGMAAGMGTGALGMPASGSGRKAAPPAPAMGAFAEEDEEEEG